MGYQVFNYKDPFVLESGKKLPELQIAFHTYGKLNQQKSNVIWVCHALTANSDVFDWWKGLFGYNNLFNPDEHFIVCANILSSHYGSSNPLSLNKETGLPFYLSFPELTVRDLVSAHQLLANHLDIEEISLLIGGSLGGQQALEWSIMEPEKIKNLVLLATNSVHSSWGIAFNESQRMAITADRTFYSMSPDGGNKGLKAARSIALLSYRNYQTYKFTQNEESHEKTSDFKAASYQNYQGEKLVNRFNAFSYYYLSKTMDSHHVGRNRRTVENALSLIKARTLIVGITSDVLFPVEEQIFLSEHIPHAQFELIDSLYGHDGFLIETELLTKIISKFLKDSAIGKPELNLHN
ncbi:homoserine O-acetyltransferase family protein [Daejeonella oryzae]|uniref:homoserine O-acetyltransferase family protein n=1 Tax=Daejeonella oryzae TaxID=1122943 RepID=UPI00042898DD|nr:homoserine O-acetyltransferase [Daejeonella oryzae]